MNLDIIYEEDGFLICNKPNNLLIHHSHFARNIDETSLAQLVRKYVGAKIHPIHRLDRKTSGAVLFAKNVEMATSLRAIFENHQIQKTYYALVRGYLDQEGLINYPIKSEDDKDYKDAETRFLCVEQVEFDRPVEPYPKSRYSLAKLSPLTGRTHQLRKHMNKIAHPIIGDPRYGNRHHNHAFQNWFNHPMLFLHAHSLEFQHPISGEQFQVKAEFPEFWATNLKDLGFKQDLQLL